MILKKIKKIFGNRRFKYGTLATVLTAALVVFVVVLNVVCTTLTTDYSLKLDLTSNSLYELELETKQMIDKIDKEVEFIIYSSENDYVNNSRTGSYGAQTLEILRRIVQSNPKFSLTFVDPDKNPTYGAQFGSQYNIGQYALIMKCGDKLRVEDALDLYHVDDETYVISYLIQERVAAALMSFTLDIEETVYFVTGHGESADTGLRTLFANNGYTVEDILLADGMSFDAEATLMIIAAPQLDYSVAEVSAVEQFLTNDYEYGRNLMYFTGAANTAMPNLESLLYDWGIEVNEDMVLEGDSARIYYQPTIFTCDVVDNDLTETMNAGMGATIISIAKSVSPRFETDSGLTVMPVLQTSELAYAKSTADGRVVTTIEKESGDTEGPINVAVLSQLLKVANNQNVYSHVFVAGSSEMLASDYLTSANNGNFILSVYDLMMQRDDTILNTVKSANNTSITFTDAEKTTANIVILALLPGIILIIGVAVFLRRRYL